MILSNFLSRETHDDSNPYEIILISFNMYKVLHEMYYSIETKEQYLVQTQLQMKSSRIALPKVHGTKKRLDTNVLPEKQKPQLQNKQGRSGIRCKKTSTC